MGDIDESTGPIGGSSGGGGWGPLQGPAAPPPPPPPPTAPWSWRNRKFLIALGVLLLVVPIFAGLLVQVPYYLISPGEARGVAELIKVKGDGAKIYPPKGKILFTTVSLAGQVNVFEALEGWLDKEVQVVPEKTITGG
ncbi:MAG: Lon-like protease, partial [Actinomycetota bacterium]|nr:Lon-like protease [Actinomycetota bacterium]